MSYYASGGGEMILNKKSRKNLDAIQHVLDCTADEAFDYTKIDNNGQSLYVCKNYADFNGDATENFLKEICPFIKNGESLEFRGEDYEMWRYIKRQNKWYEESAIIHYSKKKAREVK